MITERLSRLLASAAPGARALGFVEDAVTLAARQRHPHSAWTPHLVQTRRGICEHLPLASPTAPIVVLGAGTARDLPLEALNAHPAGATLVDAVLLPQTRLGLRWYPRVRFEVADVTGLLARRAETGRIGLDDIAPVAPLPIAGAGMVVSVNLLSQLVFPFADSPPVTERDRVIADKLFRAHLAALAALAAADCPVLLITDTAREETRAGTITRDDTVSAALIEEYFPAPRVASWDWLVAPRGELGPDVEIRFEVGAWFRPGGG